MDISEEELHTLYTWVDEIPLSRPKRNIARDFSDGVLMAETIKHYFPNLVELHNYSPANAVTQKMYNWETLNTRVFKRLGFSVPRAEAESVANCVPGAVERVLKLVKVKMATYKARKTGGGDPQGPYLPRPPLPRLAGRRTPRPRPRPQRVSQTPPDRPRRPTMAAPRGRVVVVVVERVGRRTGKRTLPCSRNSRSCVTRAKSWKPRSKNSSSWSG